MSDEPTSSAQIVASADGDRASLVERGRQFLLSPHVQNEDVAAKRRFLEEKGLAAGEISELLREQARASMPAVPPRTYPRPLPSNLPAMLAGALRLLMWGAGVSAFMVMVYYRFILPRLTRSADARRSLKSHQQNLMSRLVSSAQELRDTQRNSFALLPQFTASGEFSPYADCASVDQIISKQDEIAKIPAISLLRCAIIDLDLAAGPTTEELFGYLHSKIPSLREQPEYQEHLWQALNESSRFKNTAETPDDPAHWIYVAPPPAEPTPILMSLNQLGLSVAQRSMAREQRSFSQHTLQALADFTGYLTAQTYSLSSKSLRIPGVATDGPDPLEDGIRKDIRALKGLVLSRKSFIPPRPASTST